MIQTAPPDSANPELLARTFKAVGDERRVRILELLGEGELCVCDLSGALDMSQPLLSFHLRTLREAGLVAARKEGRWVHYSLIRENLQAISETTHRLAEGSYQSNDETGRAARARCCRRQPDN